MPETQEEFDARCRADHPESYPAAALFDGTHAVMSAADFFGLPEYSHSVPTGVIPGKCWRRRKKWLNRGVEVPFLPEEAPASWLVGRYDPLSDDKCRTMFREVLLA